MIDALALALAEAPPSIVHTVKKRKRGSRQRPRYTEPHKVRPGVFLWVGALIVLKDGTQCRVITVDPLFCQPL